MKVIVLSSGSKGNTTYIETKESKILIDAGNTSKYIVSKLFELEINPKEIDAILITHTHSDHIKGLESLIKKVPARIYMTEKMYPYLKFVENYEFITSKSFMIKDIKVDVIKTSHDTEDSVGYIITNDDKSVVYITDTGYINQKYDEILSNRGIYILESNHDIEMLNNGSYPFALRKRILSDKGHLSNYDSSAYLAKFMGPKTKKIVLAHLSEENNTPELALSTLKERLKSEKINFKNIIIAKQNEETELIEI